MTVCSHTCLFKIDGESEGIDIQLSDPEVCSVKYKQFTCDTM